MKDVQNKEVMMARQKRFLVSASVVLNMACFEKMMVLARKKTMRSLKTYSDEHEIDAVIKQQQCKGNNGLV